MRIVTTRDSVCMGDDCRAPHEGQWLVPAGSTLRDTLDRVVGGCPRMSNACWVAHFAHRQAAGEPLAVASPEWPRVRLLPAGVAADALGAPDDGMRIHWTYRTGVRHPDALWRQLGGAA
ncbi:MULTISPECIES: hypothetical protein [Kitasatospora]|uniref:Uncharacterized protein n=1 Tax=Kitasatospora setae (strain ATCC 33774 / DSM 43861 / JCM 3304 / KCC A-0304 / NBRC 14216 / KM-6054) TaxID=452652 RepID=E4N858_KITSK|nr:MULTISPECIES: hypothetical protein [Kitasatospora]BAJ27389.1 hypothetical protein KSE_15620 [Kitasatospora setae KM-6054]